MMLIVQVKMRGVFLSLMNRKDREEHEGAKV